MIAITTKANISKRRFRVSTTASLAAYVLFIGSGRVNYNPIVSRRGATLTVLCK